MSPRSARAGFSLVELLVAMVVTLVLLGMLTEANRASGKLSDATLTLGGLEEGSSQAVLSMSSDLRWAQPDTMLITPDNGSDRVDFQIAEGYDGTDTVWSTPIAYFYEPMVTDANENGIADEGQLVRSQDGRNRVVCRNLVLGGLAIQRNGNIVDLQVSVFGLTEDAQVVLGEAQTSVTLVNRTDP